MIIMLLYLSKDFGNNGTCLFNPHSLLKFYDFFVHHSTFLVFSEESALNGISQVPGMKYF